MGPNERKSMRSLTELLMLFEFFTLLDAYYCKLLLVYAFTALIHWVW